MQPDIQRIEGMLNSKAPILINNRFAKVLGFDDMRDLFASIHEWGYSRDFTYDTKTVDMQRFLRAYLRETYLD